MSLGDRRFRKPPLSQAPHLLAKTSTWLRLNPREDLIRRGLAARAKVRMNRADLNGFYCGADGIALSWTEAWKFPDESLW